MGVKRVQMDKIDALDGVIRAYAMRNVALHIIYEIGIV